MEVVIIIKAVNLYFKTEILLLTSVGRILLYFSSFLHIYFRRSRHVFLRHFLSAGANKSYISPFRSITLFCSVECCLLGLLKQNLNTRGDRKKPFVSIQIETFLVYSLSRFSKKYRGLPCMKFILVYSGFYT